MFSFRFINSFYQSTVFDFLKEVNIAKANNVKYIKVADVKQETYTG